MYLITDTYGTRQTTWKWSQALQWLACCSKEQGTIYNRFTGKIVAVRKQS